MLTCRVLVRQNTVRSPLSQRGSSPENIENPNRDTAIRNLSNPPGFNNFEFSNRDKNGLLSICFSAALPHVRSRLVPSSHCHCYLPTARAIQYPVIHTGDSNPA